MPYVNVRRRAGEGPYACPCCGFLTLAERGGHGICPVCFWEDDGQDDQDAERVRGGPNGRLSLSRTRANFLAFGACDERRVPLVREPTAEEHPLRGDGPHS
ncbi:CPCC family cysteine-rich protein [Streptomyces sp. RFCAC02]|uniref:CPCC family cysteine-rich protein n=1 Tax=Streptomyces sp. RFCAC02 TaxID=2499143 RepID=UPI00101E89F5|nr:CPCC family cysteine-rich protein [Streptomyces sp. RFCAC02]